MCSTTLSSPYSIPDTIPGVEDKQLIDKNPWPHGTSFLGDRHWMAVMNLERVGGVDGGRGGQGVSPVGIRGRLVQEEG